MKVKEYLEAIGNNEQVTFIKMNSNEEYTTTPIRTALEWLESASGTLDSYILNDKQQPITFGSSPWARWHKVGRIKCLLVISVEEWEKLYNKEQGQTIINDIDKQVKESL